jgi:hypothetical protein
MDFIIRAEGECLKQLRYHLAIMPAVGVTDHRAQSSTIGWPGSLPFFNKVAQRLLADYHDFVGSKLVRHKFHLHDFIEFEQGNSNHR